MTGTEPPTAVTAGARPAGAIAVSVIIPTLGRPELIAAAVTSALGQTVPDIEVIVVVDGPDDATLRVLQALDDPRLRILPLPENRGLGGARHAGIDAAKAPWTAFLDDDDTWLPRKLELQLEAASRARHPLPIVTCRVIARTGPGGVIRPRRVLAEGEELSEYLFCRTRLVGGEGLVLPSTLLVPRALFNLERFRDHGPSFEGSDWLLRSIRHPGVGVEFVATLQPLVIWNCEDSRSRISTRARWRDTLAWANAGTGLLTPRARASFILNRVSAEARRSGDWAAFWKLPREAFRGSRPTFINLVGHVLHWLMPLGLRARLVAIRNRRSGAMDAAPEPSPVAKPPPDG